MGSDDGGSDEKPVHKVTLTRDFWLGKTEVTQAQYEAVMGTNPSNFKKGGNYPVENVSWKDAWHFCRKLTDIERERLPEGYEYTLPTEAQWEYAARGGNKSSGYIFSGNNTLDYVGWHEGNSNGSTYPVAQLKPNELGFYDMSGNVYEWCLDWYGAYTAGDVVDSVGPASGSLRVERGGSWYSGAGSCRSAYRNLNDPTFSYNDLGFRVALAPVQ